MLEGNTLQEYSLALSKYSSGEWVLSAEKARRTVEEFLRQKLGRPRIGLNKAIEELGIKLKKEGKTPEHVRSLIIKQLKALDNHFNESSKHSSKTNEAEAEFIIYQVGSIVRLINRALDYS